MTPEQKAEAIDKLAESISKLCHSVIRRRLGQFFDVIEEELQKQAAETPPARKDLQHPDAGPRGDRYPFGDPQ